jgi:cell division protein FtsZ
MLNFDEPAKSKFNSIIKVIGVGGGGSNAVNHMYKLGISGVDFIVCNTDKQALEVSPIPHKIQLGAALTEGLGAGALPEVGKNAALESIEDIQNILSSNTKMVFVTAGMGGGTGTGAAPVIARVAKELGILTVGIVTIPFGFEGKKRKMQAEAGIEELKQNVDTLIIISNDKLREIHGNLKLAEAFSRADDVLTIAAKSIAEVIDYTLHINLDFNDIRTVMNNSGVAIMGSALASGENRAINAVEQALASPLLNDNNIKGARYVLLNITSGTDELTMDELGEINDYIQEAAGLTAEIIQGVGSDPNLAENIKVTIIATGFKSEGLAATSVNRQPEVKKISLIDETPVAEVKPVDTPKAEEVKSAEIVNEVKPLYEEPFLKTVTPLVNEVKIEEIPAINKFEEEITLRVEEAPVSKIEEEITLRVEEIPGAETIETPTFEANEIASNVREIELTENINEITFEITNDGISKSEEENSQTVVYRLEEDNTFTQEIKEEPSLQPQQEIVFNKVGEKPQNIIHDLNASLEKSEETKVEETNQISATEEYFKRTQERIQKLKDLSFKLKSGRVLSDLENEPAYVRRGVNLGNVEHSSNNNISRYTLGENEDKKGEIKPNNPFLHDNVD